MALVFHIHQKKLIYYFKKVEIVLDLLQQKRYFGEIEVKTKYTEIFNIKIEIKTFQRFQSDSGSKKYNGKLLQNVFSEIFGFRKPNFT